MMHYKIANLSETRGATAVHLTAAEQHLSTIIPRTQEEVHSLAQARSHLDSIRRAVSNEEADPGFGDWQGGEAGLRDDIDENDDERSDGGTTASEDGSGSDSESQDEYHPEPGPSSKRRRRDHHK